MTKDEAIDVEAERELFGSAFPMSSLFAISRPDDERLREKMEFAFQVWLAAKRSIAANTGTTAKAEGWISEHDDRRPKHGEPILMFIRTIHYGESDEGHLTSQEGQEIAMGEYRKSEHGDYFDCYTSPMSDNDWITHWQPLPAPPATPATTEIPCKKN